MTSERQALGEGGNEAHRRAILILVVVATGLASLEVGLVTVTLPTLAEAFDAPQSTVQWVAISYQLAIVGSLILFGRLVDVHGGRKLYLLGMATILCSAILAAASPHLIWLIVARGLLGLGAAMLLATGQALITTAYGDQGRGRALGVMHMAVAGGLMSGPAVGGLLVTVVDWRAIFLAPVPFALTALVWGWRVLPVFVRTQQTRLDLLGAVLIFISAASGVFALTRLVEHGWNEFTVALVTIALLCVGAFITVERRHPAPLVELSLLTRWSLTSGLVAAFLTFIAMASNMFLIPFSLQDLMGHSAAEAGLLMMVVPLSILPVAPFAGSLADRYGVRLPATAGLVAVSAAIVGMSQFKAETSLLFAITVLALYGIGAGLFQAPNNSAVLGAAPEDRVGTVSGMLALSRNLGQVAGVAIASGIWTLRHSQYEQMANWSQLQILGASLRDSYLVLFLVGLVALVVSVLRR